MDSAPISRVWRKRAKSVSRSTCESLPLAPGAKIDNAISDGEDYELLFAISPRDRKRLQRNWRKKFPKLPLTRIGKLHRTSTSNIKLLPGGYVHFK